MSLIGWELSVASAAERFVAAEKEYKLIYFVLISAYFLTDTI